MLRRLVASILGSGNGGNVAIRVARAPRLVEERRVADMLDRLPVRTRGALVDALADELRLAEKDPFRGALEVGIWRLALYRRAADELVNSLLGDFLVEDRGSTQSVPRPLRSDS